MFGERAELALQECNRVRERLSRARREDLRALSGFQLNRPELGASIVNDRHAALVGRSIESRGGVKHLQAAYRVRERGFVALTVARSGVIGLMS